MEEPPRVHSALQSRTNKFLHGLSQFKGIIRISGRKSKDDRDLEHHPYPSQMGLGGRNSVIKPYMSQPHLGLEQGLQSGHHNDEVFKLSSSERSPSPLCDEEAAQHKKASVDQDFPLRTSPRSGRNATKSDPPRPLPPSPPPMQIQNTIAGESTQTNTRGVDGLPHIIDPTIPLAALSAGTPMMPTPLPPPKAQPTNKRPTTAGGFRRPSNASSVQTTATNATVKAGPLLKLKRSLSQLRLNSSSKQHPDVASSGATQTQGQPFSQNPTNTPAPATASTATSTNGLLLSPPSSKHSKPTTTITSPSLNTPVPTNNTTYPTHSYPQSANNNTMLVTSGALAPMSIPKPLPGPGVQRHVPTQPPKLSLPPINHRISLTMGTDMGSARLSPTVISRPMPLPLLNLPTLTPRSDSLTGASIAHGGTARRMQRARPMGQMDEEQRMGKSHLESMPALPIQGTGRGVRGHEEMDEDDDESADDDDVDEDDEEEGESGRYNTSRSGFLAPTMSEDGIRSSFDSSTSSMGSNGMDYFVQRSYSNERQRSPSTGSSYHSARSEFSPPPNSTGMDAVPILKYPTPPRGHTHAHTQPLSQASASGSAPAPASGAAAAASSNFSSKQSQSLPEPASSAPKQSRLQHAAAARNNRLPEVDTSRLDLSFGSRSAVTTTPVDVKGKGKARDFSANATSIVTGGNTVDNGGDQSSDPSKTPTITSNGPFRGFISSQTQTQSRLKTKSPTAQSPTGTLRESKLQHAAGSSGSGGDYFSSKVGTSTGSATSPTAPARPGSLYTTHRDLFSSSAYPPPRPLSSYSPSTYFNPYSAYSPYSHSRSPTIQVQTPRAGGGMRTHAGLFVNSGMPAPKRSSTVLVTGTSTGGVDGGGGDGTGGGGGGGGNLYAMPTMFKRASQSLVDLHTIETKEKKKAMEEEVRAEEDKELVRMREREKERERENRLRDKRERERERERGRERDRDRERENRRSEDDKIKEDETEAERRDQLGAPPKVPSKPTTALPTTAATPTTTRSEDVDTEMPASSSTSAAPAAGKKLNRLSTASHILRRRRSMPVYEESSEPPPYPSFAPHHPGQAQFIIMPREDEGRERLPGYTNHIYLKAIMPRKLEFSSPGVQAKDRKWRRVMCVLEGTMMKIYKCPPGHAGVGVIGEWWEKQVGAGDVSMQPSHSGTMSTIQIETKESRRLAEEQRDIERQIQRIMKAEGGSGSVDFGTGEIGGEAVIVPLPPPTRGRAEAQSPGSPSAATPTATGQSPRSKFGFLKPGKHSRSRSDVQLSERNTPSGSPRPSLSIPSSSSGRTTPGSTSGRSTSPVGLRAQTPMSSSSQSFGVDSSGQATPTSSAYSSFRGHQPQQQQQQEYTSDEPPALRYMYSNRERDTLPDPHPDDLIHVYSLQNAESGIGNDYFKRKNVIRLRLEGEQFLLQARDVTGVVEWIEALQAAANIALDLDERPMPRGPLFPRRRRRRRPQIASTTQTTGSTSRPPPAPSTVSIPPAISVV